MRSEAREALSRYQRSLQQLKFEVVGLMEKVLRARSKGITSASEKRGG